MTTFHAAFMTFFGCFIFIPILLGICQLFGIYTILRERECKVYVLFGKVVAILDEPGLHSLWLKIGPIAAIVQFLGTCYTLDMRLDQEYLRSQPVNSEEGAPMGIGIWCEMFISDPVAYLFKNMDPRGSLRANVTNATVRCLSNLKLAEMLVNRHHMSATVRNEVSPKSQEWGYKLGSVYIRKVHFRDRGMIEQIEQKVVNRLRQVTAAIRQDGTNQVNLITSAADRQAAIEFGKASALRPFLVGTALQAIAQDKQIIEALFDILETQKILESDGTMTMIPPGGRNDLMTQYLAARGPADAAPPPAQQG